MFFLMLFLNDYLSPSVWWMLLTFMVSGVILYPAATSYRIFMEENKKVLENSLCTSCEFFDKSAVLCLKHDEHPSETYLPCDGIDWRPQSQSEIEDFSDKKKPSRVGYLLQPSENKYSRDSI